MGEDKPPVATRQGYLLEINTRRQIVLKPQSPDSKISFKVFEVENGVEPSIAVEGRDAMAVFEQGCFLPPSAELGSEVLVINDEAELFIKAREALIAVGIPGLEATVLANTFIHVVIGWDRTEDICVR